MWIVLVAGMWVGFRNRAWRSGLALVGLSALLTGAAPVESVIIGGGGAAGSYVETCGPRRTYKTAAIEAEYRRPAFAETELVLGAQLAAAVEDGPPNLPDGYPRIYSLGILPTIGLDGPYASVSVGVLTGPLVFGGSRIWTFPSFSFRGGSRSSVYLEGSLGQHFAGPLPRGWLRLGIGFGLIPRARAPWNYPMFQFGVSDSGVYGLLELPTTKASRLELWVAYADESTWHFAVGVKFKLTRKELQ